MKALLLALGFAMLAPQSDDVNIDDAIENINKHRDDTSEDILEVLRLDGTQKALDGLVEVYAKLETTYMRIQLLSVICTYDGLSGNQTMAAEFIAKAAANSADPEVRNAAVVALSNCPSSGALALRELIGTPIAAKEREKALEFFIQMAPSNDLEFLKGIYELPHLKKKPGKEKGKKSRPKPKKKKKKKGADDEGDESDGPKTPRNTAVMRKMALNAIWTRLELEDLERFYKRERNQTLRPLLLRALDQKQHKDIEESVERLIGQAGAPEELRLAAAEIIAKRKGESALPLFMDVAKSKATTPRTLYLKMAQLMKGMPNELVSEALLGRLSKAKGPELTFLMDAMPLPCEAKVLKKLAKGLKSKEPNERIAAARFLSRVGGEDSIKRLTKALKSEKEVQVMGALLEGLSKTQKGVAEWEATLHEYCEDKDDELKHAARMEVLRQARGEDFDLFVTWLQDSDWSIRMGALVALESQKDPATIKIILDQMEKETGRLRYEFSETLFRLTGKDFGERIESWKAWFEREGAEAEVLSQSEVQEAERLRVLKAQKERSRTPRFFDIEIRSERIIFVIDVSGSMEEELGGDYENIKAGTRMERAKKELLKALEAIRPATFFNIIAFSGGVGAWSDEPLGEMDEPDREDAKDWVDSLGAGGGTNLYEALVEAMADPDVDTIVVLSDGEPSVGAIIDPGEIREDIAARNRERNIQINTISLGGQLQILQWLAEDSGGVSVEYE